MRKTALILLLLFFPAAVQAIGRFATGCYDGNSQLGNRFISTVFDPKVVILKIQDSGNSRDGYWRSDQMPAGTHCTWDTAATNACGLTNRIVSLVTGGFNVIHYEPYASGDSANRAGWKYCWYAYGGDGVTTGQYVGDGTTKDFDIRDQNGDGSPDIGAPNFNPEVVYAYRTGSGLDNGAGACIRTLSMQVAQDGGNANYGGCFDFDTSNVPNGINRIYRTLDLDPFNGFQVGPERNKATSGVHYWFALNADVGGNGVYTGNADPTTGLTPRSFGTSCVPKAVFLTSDNCVNDRCCGQTSEAIQTPCCGEIDTGWWMQRVWKTEDPSGIKYLDGTPSLTIRNEAGFGAPDCNWIGHSFAWHAPCAVAVPTETPTLAPTFTQTLTPTQTYTSTLAPLPTNTPTPTLIPTCGGSVVISTSGASAVSSVPGSTPWLNPTNCLANDGFFCNVATQNVPPSDDSERLLISDFSANFAGIPNTAHILGIRVRLVATQDNGSASGKRLDDFEIKLITETGGEAPSNKSGTFTSPAEGGAWWKQTQTAPVGTPEDRIYGAYNDTWGRSWTGADVKDSDFGAIIRVFCTSLGGGNCSPVMDAVEIQICHDNFVPTPTPTAGLTPSVRPPCLTRDGVWRQNCNFVAGGFLKPDTPDSASFYPPPTVSFNADAASTFPDGTLCVLTPMTINIGPTAPIESVLECTGVGGTFEGNFWMPTEYNGDPVSFEMSTIFTDSSSNGGVGWSFECSCRGNGDLIDGVYGPLDVMVINYQPGDQFVVRSGMTPEITCDGPCLGGDVLFWKAKLFAESLGANLIDSKILQIKMRFGTTGAGDE